jgi:hypothetical protein
MGKAASKAGGLGVIWNLKLYGLAAAAILSLSAASAWYAYKQGRESGMQQVQTLWDSEKLAMTQAQNEELMKARQRERALQALIAKQRKEHAYESNRLSILYQSALSSLSDRADRPAENAGGVPKDSSAGAESARGCTGANLFRSDAEFLVGEAARADQLRIALKACIAHTAEVERELNR